MVSLIYFVYICIKLFKFLQKKDDDLRRFHQKQHKNKQNGYDYYPIFDSMNL